MRVVEEREGGRRWRFGEKAAEGTGSAKEDCVLSALSISTHIHTHALQQLQQPRSLRVTCRLPQSMTYERLAVAEPPQLPLTSEAPNHNYSNLTQSSLPLPVLFPYSSLTLSLWTSHRLSNSSTWSPSFTNHFSTSTSAMPSPMSARLNGITASCGAVLCNQRGRKAWCPSPPPRTAVCKMRRIVCVRLWRGVV